MFDEARPLTENKPTSQRELDRCEALKLYGLAVLSERGNRLVEAVSHLEQAQRLDPESLVILKTLAPLYVALQREDDALQTCKRLLDLDPGDYEIWYLYARQMKSLNRPKDSLAALERGAACPGLKQHPELRMHMCFELGGAFEKAENYDRAEAAFRVVAEVLDDPNAVMDDLSLSHEEIDAQASEILERLGRICVQSKHFDRAKTYYLKAQAKAEPKDPSRAKRLSFNLAEVLVAQEDYQGALAPLQEYLDRRPLGNEAYELKIIILRKLKRVNEILPFLEECHSGDLNNDLLKMLLAKECRLEGKRSRAEELYLDAANANPDADTYHELFTLWKEDKDPGLDRILTLLDGKLATPGEGVRAQRPQGDAVHARAMLQALRGDSALVGQLLPRAVLRLGTPRGLNYQTMFFMAVLAAQTKQADSAELLFRGCLKNEDLARSGTETEVYVGLLTLLDKARKHEAVVKLCRDGLAHAQITSKVMFHLELAESLILLGKPEEAIASADSAVDLARAEEKLRCGRLRAWVLAQANHRDKAIAQCQELFKEYTEPADVKSIRHTLATVYTLDQDVPKAVEQLELILQDDAEDATAHNDLGYLWADKNKNLDEAEKHIRQALDLDKKQKADPKKTLNDDELENAAFIDSLGWVLFRKGQFKAARVQLEKASKMSLGYDDPVVWDHLGDVYQRLSETEKAREVWKKAVDLYENGHARPQDDRYKDIKQKLQLLDRPPRSR